MRHRLAYTQELATNLFVSLPVATKRTFVHLAQQALQYPTFVETGAFAGDMADLAGRLFPRVHTIELDPVLAERAAARFASVPHVTVHHGDSGQVLRDLLPTLVGSCLFWLDAHYSGGITARGETDTPILAELDAIAESGLRPVAILIDDARVFGTDDAYPTIEEVIARLRAIDPRFFIGVTADILWATPVRILRFEWQVAPNGAVVPPTTAPRLRSPALR
jgi:hypothetical protein